MHTEELQSTHVRCSVLQCVAVCRSVLQCVAVCCSVLQFVAVCRSALHTEELQGTHTYIRISQRSLILRCRKTLEYSYIHMEEPYITHTYTQKYTQKSSKLFMYKAYILEVESSYSTTYM